MVPLTKSLSVSMSSFVAVLVYMCCAVAMILFNKATFSVYQLEAPNVLTLGQNVCSMCFFVIFSKTGVLKIRPLSLSNFRRMLPLSSFFLAYMVMGMLAMKTIDIPLLTTLKRTTIVFVMILDSWLNGKAWSICVHIAVIVIASSALFAGWGSSSFSVSSIVTVLLLNCSTALYLIQINKEAAVDAALPADKSLSKFDYMLYNSVACIAVLLLMLPFTGELSSFLATPLINDTGFQLSFFFSSLLAFLLNYSIFLNTSLNSALTQTVSGQAKDVLVVSLSFVLFGDASMSSLSLFGVCLGFIGSILFAGASALSQPLLSDESQAQFSFSCCVPRRSFSRAASLVTAFLFLLLLNPSMFLSSDTIDLSSTRHSDSKSDSDTVRHCPLSPDPVKPVLLSIVRNDLDDAHHQRALSLNMDTTCVTALLLSATERNKNTYTATPHPLSYAHVPHTGPRSAIVFFISTAEKANSSHILHSLALSISAQLDSSVHPSVFKSFLRTQEQAIHFLPSTDVKHLHKRLSSSSSFASSSSSSFSSSSSSSSSASKSARSLFVHLASSDAGLVSLLVSNLPPLLPSLALLVVFGPVSAMSLPLWLPLFNQCGGHRIVSTADCVVIVCTHDRQVDRVMNTNVDWPWLTDGHRRQSDEADKTNAADTNADVYSNINVMNVKMTTLLPSMTVSRACRMHNHFAAVSVNDNPSYAILLPLSLTLWYHVTGYKTVLMLVGETWVRVLQAKSMHELSLEDHPLWHTWQSILAFQRRFGSDSVIISIAPKYLIDSAHVSRRNEFVINLGQSARLFASALPQVHIDDYLLTADSDIVPMNYEFFRHKVDPDKRMRIIRATCCGTFQVVDRRSGLEAFEADTIPHHAMSYVGARASVWRELMFSDISFSAFEFSDRDDDIHGSTGTEAQFLIAMSHDDVHTPPIFLPSAHVSSLLSSLHIPLSSVCASSLSSYHSYSSFPWSESVRVLSSRSDDYYTRVTARKAPVHGFGRFWYLDEYTMSTRLNQWTGYPHDIQFDNNDGRQLDRRYRQDFEKKNGYNKYDHAHLVREPNITLHWELLKNSMETLMPTNEWKELELYVNKITTEFAIYPKF